MPHPLFSIQLVGQDDLNNGKISRELRQALCKQKLKLSSEAEAVVKKKNTEWMIADPSKNQKYQLKRVGRWMWKKLEVYQLKNLRKDFPEIKRQLMTKGTALDGPFTIRVLNEGNEWEIIDWRIDSSQPLPDMEQRPIHAYHIEIDREVYRFRDIKKNRVYQDTILPTLRMPRRSSNQQDLLFKLYSEICSSWRQLTDVRFKLLGLVPTVSVVILISLLSRPEGGNGLTHLTQTLVTIVASLSI